MSEFFKFFGIAFFVALGDVFVCICGIIATGSWKEDDVFLGPLIVNSLGFVVVTAILLGERIG